MTPKPKLVARRPRPFPPVRRWGDHIAPSTAEHDPVLTEVIIKLEEGNCFRLANRIRELREGEEESVGINEASASQFSSIFLRTEWPEPTSVGLNDQGEISATWVNRPDAGEGGEHTVPGSAVLGVPADGKLFEVTAMFGVQAPGREWVQVVGKINDKMALGLIDSVLMGFSNELRTAPD